MPSIPTLRLSYGPRRDLSTAKSIIGFLIILHGLAGAIVATLFTEGRTTQTSVVEYLRGYGPGNYGTPIKDAVATTCGRTVIQAGQTFDEKVSGASFNYMATNSFSYGGEQLTGCFIDPSVEPTIILRPPVANPVMEILDLTVICNTSVSLGGARFAPSGSSGSLEGTPFLSGTPGGWSAKLNVSAPTSAGNYAFSVKIYETNGTITSVSNNDTRAYEPLGLVNELIVDIQQDFQTFNEIPGPMVLLPNVLFPCTKKETVWKNAGDVFWYCVIAVAAVFAPLYMLTVWALTSDAEKKSVNNALNINGVRRNSGMSRIVVDRDAQVIGGDGGVDHIPMAPTSPRNSDAHVLNLNDTKTDEELDPDHKAPLPDYESA